VFQRKVTQAEISEKSSPQSPTVSFLNENAPRHRQKPVDSCKLGAEEVRESETYGSLYRKKVRMEFP
jgi:hypothetical protein